MRWALPVLLLALAARSVSAQQCPDGTPAPCGPQPAHAPSVAILFMEPRSRNAADSLLAEGLTLEIINTLSGVTRLDVKSRFFSRRIAADADPVRSARVLGVDYLVDGVLELDSARVLVRGALTRTSTGRVVRPIRIERRRAELEGLQAAVAREIAAAVVGQLLPSEQAQFAVRRVDPRVSELLFSARALRQHYTSTTVQQALTFARQAVVIDSTYAPAWVEIALCYRWLPDFEPDSGTVYAARSSAANGRALALDSSNGEALLRLAASRATANDVSPRTEALARRGAALSAGVERGIGLAWVLMQIGKVEEALGAIRDAATRDSLSPVVWAVAAYRFFDARHYAEAVEAWQRALALRPSAQDSSYFRYARRWARLEGGDCAGALADAESAPDTLLMATALRCLHRTADADSVIEIQLSHPTTSPSRRAVYLAWRNQPDSAFAVLDRTFPLGLGLTLQHPAFDPYRQHPAYLALRRRMGLDR